MAIDLSDHPDFKVENDKYKGALTAAKSADDETAQLRAELAWRDTQSRFTEDLTARQQATAKLEAAKAKAKAEAPDVPEALYESVTDPDKLIEVTAQLQKSISDAKQQSAAGSWPTPPTGAAPSSEKDPYNNPDYLVDLSNRLFSSNASQVSRARDEIINKYLDVTWERMKKGDWSSVAGRGQ